MALWRSWLSCASFTWCTWLPSTLARCLPESGKPTDWHSWAALAPSSCCATSQWWRPSVLHCVASRIPMANPPWSTILRWYAWSSTDHQHMLVLGGIASCIPIGFLSMASVVLRMLPKFLAKGDTAFLHAFSFLFFRFPACAFWYALVLLARNTGMALAPALHEETLQLFVVCAHTAAVHGDQFCGASMASAYGEPPGRRNQRELRAGGLPWGPFQRRDKTLIGDLLLVILGLLGLMFLIASCICVNSLVNLDLRTNELGSVNRELLLLFRCGPRVQWRSPQKKVANTCDTRLVERLIGECFLQCCTAQ